MKAVEFMLVFRNQASSVVDKITKEFRNARGEVERMSNSFGTVEQRINGIGSKLKKAFSSIPGAAFLTNPLVLLTTGVGAVAKLGMENEKASVSFEVLLQSADKAKKMLGEINKYADKTPYERMGLRDAAKMMLGFGIAEEKIMPNLKMLGDIAGGDKEKMNQLTLAFSQMSSAGKLNGQDLLQMINAGFNPLNEISKMTGKSIGTLRKEMEKGQISSQMVEEAFKHATSAGGIFYGMTERMGKTLGGRISTLVDSFKNRLLDLYQIIGPILSTSVDGLTKLLDLLATPVSWLVKGFANFFGALKDGNPFIWASVAAMSAFTIALQAHAIGIALVTKLTKIAATAQWLWNIAVHASPLTWVITGIVAFATVSVLAFQKLGWFRGAVLATWEAVKGFGLLLKDFVVDGITGMLKGIGGLGKALMLLFKGDFKNAWKTAGESAKDLLGINAAKNAVGNFKEIGKNAGNAYQKGLAEVAAIKKYKSQGTAWIKTAAYGTGENISEGLVPGTNIAYGTTGEKDTKTLNSTTATQAVASGGTRNTSININLGKMVENIIFQGGLKENAQDLQKQVEEILMRALYAAQSAS